MFSLSIISFLLSLISNSSNSISIFIKSYGLLAIFILMVLEGSSLPVPSEVVLPLAGLFAAEHLISFPLALIVGILGSIVGALIDYAIGYIIGKDLVYKNLKLFHIKKERLDDFDAWFAKNGLAAVFLTRLVPIARTIINFPAGFAKMKLKDFLAYSLAGMFIWDLVLMTFGYYLLSSKSAELVLASVGIFAILLYVVYRLAMKGMKK